MNFSNILASTRNIVRFSFIRPNIGDNALATIKDLNQVIAGLNNLFPHRNFDVSITQTGIANPVITKLAAGATECPSSCSAVCSACDCKANCQDQLAGAFSFSLVRTGVGTYTLTVGGTTFTRPIQNMGMFFTPFTDVTSRVTVTQISPTVYHVNTFSGAVASDNIFNNTVVAMKFYY